MKSGCISGTAEAVQDASDLEMRLSGSLSRPRQFDMIR
jgi:hypothetical protein